MAKEPQLETVKVSAIAIIYQEDGTVLNPRGPVKDTKHLAASISKHGLKTPLHVLRTPDGNLWVEDGHRRLAALKRLKIKETVAYVREIEILDLPQIRLDMLATDQKEPFPLVVLDKKGEIIGGKALAVRSTLYEWPENGRKAPTLIDIAEIIGERPDATNAMLRLFEAPVPVLRKVATGSVSLTAFARMKMQPAEVQEQIVKAAEEKGEEVTVSHVRSELKKLRQEATQAQRGLLEMEQDDAIVAQLNQIKAELATLLPDATSARAQFVVNEIKTIIGGK